MSFFKFEMLSFLCYNKYMINENDLKKQVAKNLIYYRKMNKLTQNDLAIKLNYSDKAISKWERGENIPDLYVLLTIANLYGITLNDLTSESPSTPKVTKQTNNALITALSIGLVWLIATIAFIILIIIDPNIKKTWLSFIYAIPVSLIVSIVFSCIWGKTSQVATSVSLFSWSVPLAICLTFSFERLWFLFICIIPFQVLIILWFVLKANAKKNKQFKKDLSN